VLRRQTPQCTLRLDEYGSDSLGDAAFASPACCASLTALDISYNFDAPFTDRAFKDSITRIPHVASLRVRHVPVAVPDRAVAALARHASGTLTLLDIGDDRDGLLTPAAV
jgi:hypothetical protein